MNRQKTERYGFIESRLFWEGGLSAKDLVKAFGISRQAAQKIIGDYRADNPGQMAYNPRLKKHEALESFEPSYIRSDPIAFLDYLRGDAMVGYYRDETDWSDFEVVDVNRLLRPRLSILILKPVFSALRNRKAVLIDYRKKNLIEDETSRRIISPNHLVFTNNRYHMRAYCHSSEKFKDFVLSRISYSEIRSENWIPSEEDNDWNEWITLTFLPNSNLPKNVQKSILRNYEAKDAGKRTIQCRRALAFYIKRELSETIYNKYDMPLWEMEGQRDSNHL